MGSLDKVELAKRDLKKKHPIENFLLKHQNKLMIAAGIYILLFFVMAFINQIIGLLIFGPILLLVVIIGFILNLIIFYSKVDTLREFIFSKKLFHIIFISSMIVLALYLGREQIYDLPNYVKNNFEVYVGSPTEIEIRYGDKGKARYSTTHFILQNGEDVFYRGKIEDLDPTHEYEIEYLPNSKEITEINNLTTGEKWRHR
ncbi:hypothetical protein [Ureibacillus chungkukjangi]|uniref:Uncharacterized protein n=1 Tax=Ureibacillus chungkukjangi TaxID=1202712 RepID=A0A318TYG2_9BACL|nr:hypothetical protein [Ureibacillus chungkukjangi]MCM3387731.1 hypothetical protein [Ureibacillus chungkukjangi]PYF08048.1 hypothetical protein BJ095_103219 [Ureibacillus chungkukjangi]